MTTSITLLVNDQVIDLDYFAADFIHHVTNGMLQSLRGACEIAKLRLEFTAAGEVYMDLNGGRMDMNPFVQKIIKGTMTGIVTQLKGVDEVQSLDLTIQR